MIEIPQSRHSGAILNPDGLLPSRPRLSPARPSIAGTTALFVLVFILTTAARAQPASSDDEDAPTPEHRHGGHAKPGERGESYLDLLNHELDLTPNQRKAVQDILDKSKPERDALEKQMRELSEKAHKQRRSDSEKIRAVLTDEQKERFDEFNSRMRRREHVPMHHLRRDHGPMPDGGMPPPEMWHHGTGGAKANHGDKDHEMPDGVPEMMGAPKKNKE